MKYLMPSGLAGEVEPMDGVALIVSPLASLMCAQLYAGTAGVSRATRRRRPVFRDRTVEIHFSRFALIAGGTLAVPVIC